MKYGRKTRRFRRRIKRILRKRSSIRRLYRKVSKISRRQRISSQSLLFGTSSALTQVGTAPGYVNLCNYAQIVTNPIFGTSSFSPANTVMHRKCKMDIYVDLENIGGGIYASETATTQFTFFVVSLRDSANNGSLFNPASGVINPLPGTHYTTNMVGGGSGALVMLNTRIFRIHKMKKFVLSNKGFNLGTSTAQTQYGTNRRFSWTQRMGGVIKNPMGNWYTMFSAQDPSKQYYLLFFTDNVLADLESPQIQLNVVHSLSTLT